MVFFDVGATLISPHPSMGEIYRRVLGRLQIDAPAEELAALFSETWDGMSAEVGPGRDRYNAFPGGESGYWREFVGRVLARLNRQPLIEEATRALHDAFAVPSAWSVFPDVPDTLEWLAKRGVRMGVISNWDSRLPRLLEGLGLSSHFDPIVFSSQVGREKPSPEIFRQALARAGARPEESAHVGDDLHADYHGARAAGMSAVLVERNGRRSAGVTSVGSLQELPGRLGLDGSSRENR
jgi:putative hydrolase of the HAD superfamily